MSGMSMVRILALVAAVVGAVATPAAHADHSQTGPTVLIADATKPPYIDFYLGGGAGQTVFISEQEAGRSRPVASTTLDAAGHAAVPRGARLRCDRRTRRFSAAFSPGGPAIASFGVRTPSCRRRLEVGVPSRVRPGSQVQVVVRDRWRIGDLALRFCVQSPSGSRRCRPLRLAKDASRVTTRFRVGERGRWGTALHGPGIRVAGGVSVGEPPPSARRRGEEPSVLAAGDSMMQGLDGFLADRLGDRARVFRDVVPNSGISKPGINWLRRASDSGRRLRPDATVVFLGANEGFTQVTPSGQEIRCCSAAWAAEYTRRVRTMMRSYGRGGRGKVFWVTVPQVGIPERQLMQLTVNAAVLRAASGLRGVRMVRLDQVLTPGGRYRDVMSYRGRRVRVREVDGIHLTLHGVTIAADRVLAALRSAGVIR
ncbi:MAG: hypothetical protein M3131_10095 [Actinomycetota bacterium]|nr:hypothetical protein [Actinomycetota bacterium]